MFDDIEGVTVSTIHGAKGGEWDVVFVVAMEDGVLPHVSQERDRR